jgi:hypothetical protein
VRDTASLVIERFDVDVKCGEFRPAGRPAGHFF